MGQDPAPSNSMLPCAWRVLAASSLVMSSPSDASSSGRDRVAATSRNTPRATTAHVASAGRGQAQQPPPARPAATTVGRSEVSGAVPVVAGPPHHWPATPPSASAMLADDLRAVPVGDTTATAGDGNMILSLRDS